MADFSFESFLDDRRARINAALDAALPAQDRGGTDAGRLREGMRYAVLDGGKRMRPLLVVAACEAVGGTVDQGLPAGCALEMIHAYSLVHDDLPAMDNDLERRGKPTVHVAFGESGAILIGDALLTRAFEVLVEGVLDIPAENRVQAVRLLGLHAGIDGMVGGQAKDLALGQNIQSLDALEEVHALKTGALFAASAALGALSGGADAETVAELERFGLAFGIAFQHADDVLDDDQPALRDKAMARLEQLTAECDAIAAKHPDAKALGGFAQWVSKRAARALAGDKAD